MTSSIPRTAVPIWSPAALRSPLLATGTVSGALDASFSSDSLLELWDPFAENAGARKPLASLGVGSRFNTLAWGYVKSPERPMGVIAAGFENGEIGLWDPQVMLNADGSEYVFLSYHDLLL
jgi:protein transport protein SEC31